MTTTELTIIQRAAVALDSTKTEAQLRDLVKASSDVVAVSDQAGRDMVHRLGMSLKNARTTIQKVGKTAREDAQAFSKGVIAEEGRLISIISSEEERIFSLRDGWDNEQRRIAEEKAARERARVEAIERDIDTLRRAFTNAAGKNSGEIAQTLEWMHEQKATEERFAELRIQAVGVRAEAIEKLQEMLSAALQREEQARAEADAREVERQRVEAEKVELARQKEEQARIAAELAAQQAEIRRQQEEVAAAQRAEEARRKAEADAHAAEMKRQADAAEAERQRAAAEAKRQLEAQQTALAAERKAEEDKRRAEREAFDAERSALHAERDAMAAEKLAAAAREAKRIEDAEALAIAQRQHEDMLTKADAEPEVEAPSIDQTVIGLPVAAEAPELRLGQISERFGFTVTADFLLQLGFAPAATVKASKLYHESDFPKICATLQRHIAAVQAMHMPF